MINKEDFLFLDKVLSENKFRYAKTMPQCPHFYTLRKNWSDDKKFIKAVRLIRKHGYKKSYGKNKYIYLNINGYQYWTMGYPINYKNDNPCTILINKAKVEYQSEYDIIAEQYNKLFMDEKHKHENETIINLIKPKGSVLDIGCGTGLFLDYCNPKKYLGIDISKNMLKICKLKHKNYNVMLTSFEDYYGNGYDTVIALFGVASYLDPLAIIDKTPCLLNHGGKAFFMFYKPGYYPETYQRTGINIKYNQPLENNLKEFNNYLIWEYENI